MYTVSWKQLRCVCGNHLSTWFWDILLTQLCGQCLSHLFSLFLVHSFVYSSLANPFGHLDYQLWLLYHSPQTPNSVPSLHPFFLPSNSLKLQVVSLFTTVHYHTALSRCPTAQHINNHTNMYMYTYVHACHHMSSTCTGVSRNVQHEHALHIIYNRSIDINSSYSLYVWNIKEKQEKLTYMYCVYGKWNSFTHSLDRLQVMLLMLLSFFASWCFPGIVSSRQYILLSFFST